MTRDETIKTIFTTAQELEDSLVELISRGKTIDIEEQTVLAKSAWADVRYIKELTKKIMYEGPVLTTPRSGSEL